MGEQLAADCGAAALVIFLGVVERSPAVWDFLHQPYDGVQSAQTAISRGRPLDGAPRSGAAGANWPGCCGPTLSQCGLQLAARPGHSSAARRT